MWKYVNLYLDMMVIKKKPEYKQNSISKTEFQLLQLKFYIFTAKCSWWTNWLNNFQMKRIDKIENAFSTWSALEIEIAHKNKWFYIRGKIRPRK